MHAAPLEIARYAHFLVSQECYTPSPLALPGEKEPSQNLVQRSIRTPKVYLNDTGLLAHLLALSPERLETDPSLAGALAENFAMMELVKQSTWSETKPKIFYWRTASGREVDIVLEDSAGRIVGLEMKAGATLNPNDTAGLRALTGNLPVSSRRPIPLSRRANCS